MKNLSLKTWWHNQMEQVRHDSPEQTARRSILAYLATHHLRLQDIAIGLTIPWMTEDYSGVVIIDGKTEEGRLQCRNFASHHSHRRYPTSIEIEVQ